MVRTERQWHASRLREVGGRLRPGFILTARQKERFAKACAEAAKFLDDEQAAVERFVKSEEERGGEWHA